MNDSTYHIAFEDVGISPMFQDLLVVVVVHGASVASTNTVTLQLYSGSDVFYGDENFLSVDAVTDGGDSYTFPAGTVFTFAVTSGAEWGILYDYDSGREGTVLNDIPWQEPFGPDVSFRAWGNSPTTEQHVTVTVSTLDPNVLPGSTDFFVLPVRST